MGERKHRTDEFSRRDERKPRNASVTKGLADGLYVGKSGQGQTCSWADPASHPVGTRGYFPGDEAAGT
jgi:hypothetical protein